jgi:hypothetical protein
MSPKEWVEEVAFVGAYVQQKYPDIYAEAVEERKFRLWLEKINADKEKVD